MLEAGRRTNLTFSQISSLKLRSPSPHVLSSAPIIRFSIPLRRCQPRGDTTARAPIFLTTYDSNPAATTRFFGYKALCRGIPLLPPTPVSARPHCRQHISLSFAEKLFRVQPTQQVAGYVPSYGNSSPSICAAQITPLAKWKRLAIRSRPPWPSAALPTEGQDQSV